MTELEYLSCEDPVKLLRLPLPGHKARLFAAACVRRVWHLLSPDGRANVERAEQDLTPPAQPDPLREPTFLGSATSREAAAMAARLACGDMAEATLDCPRVAATALAISASTFASESDPEAAHLYGQAEYQAERRPQAALLRELIGNPFRPARVEAAWLTPTVIGLAHAVYEGRVLPAGHLDPVRLMVLADALEEGGSADAAVLGHCHRAGEHTRGCWLLDLILSHCS